MWWLGLTWLAVASGSSLETNMIGQPEIIQFLPDDNHLSPMPYTSGTYHFVSSNFPEVDSRGFHESVFDGIGDYYPSWPSAYFKRYQKSDMSSQTGGFRGLRRKRSAEENRKDEAVNVPKSKKISSARYARGMEMGSSGFHGDTFGSDFGDFVTMRRRRDYLKKLFPVKRRPEMDSMGFHGDTFGSGFGEFETMKRGAHNKRRPEMDSMGFHGDTFGNGFGEFDTMRKRRPEMDSMGFHGDTFGNGFGEFDTMKKRRPEMDSMGFYGDTFSQDLGNFYTMKRARGHHPYKLQ